MSFVRIPGIEGRLYVPNHDPDGMRKHDCEGCFSCQMCSDGRCALCLQAEGCRPGPEDPLTNKAHGIGLWAQGENCWKAGSDI